MMFYIRTTWFHWCNLAHLIGRPKRHYIIKKQVMADASGDRQAVLERRRALRKAKKAKGKSFKEQKQRERYEKKQEIVAKIRAKREAAQNGGGAYGGNGGKDGQDGGCWLCGESGASPSLFVSAYTALGVMLTVALCRPSQAGLPEPSG